MLHGAAYAGLGVMIRPHLSHSRCSANENGASKKLAPFYYEGGGTLIAPFGCVRSAVPLRVSR